MRDGHRIENIQKGEYSRGVKKMRKLIVAIAALFFTLGAFSLVHSKIRIWACSNHNPAHTATNATEMQSMTNTYGCTGWHNI